MKKFMIFIFIIFLVNSNLNAQLKAVTYNDGEQILNGFAIAPKNKSKSKPGVLILPAWKGIDEHSKDSAEKLAKLGYYSFVADIYGEGNYPKNAEESGKNASYYKKNYLEYQRRINLALEQLKKYGANAENIVIIGYCFGGTGVLEAARSDLKIKGVISFHGGLGKDNSRPTNLINTKILILHGADDFYVPKEEIAAFQKEMRDGKADWQMIYYANAVHAFSDPAAGNDNSKGAAFNQLAAKRSWEHMKLFLSEVLKK